jgi:vesicular inhibitory amino acid transporter
MAQQSVCNRLTRDLIWSYSRSQAYFGDNITRSPSFVERHWHGNNDSTPFGSDADQENDSEVTRGGDLDTDVGDDLPDDESVSSLRVRDRPTTGVANNKLYWPRVDSSKAGETQNRRKSYTQRSWRGASDYDEGLSDELPEESMRSRSPMRLGTAPPQPGANISVTQEYDRESSRAPRDSPRYQQRSQSRFRHNLRTAAPHLRDPYLFSGTPEESSQFPVDDEETQLLRKSRKNTQTNPVDGSGFALGHGLSTFWQTWFNTVNALIGVGILALPLAFAYSGWILGTLLFLLCGLLTNYTGKTIARILARQPALQTYADIGGYAFGPATRVIIGIVFYLEMSAVSVALIVLAGDCLAVLVYGSEVSEHPHVATTFKVLALAASLPTLFLPLNLLSPVSIVGILSILVLSAVILVDGLMKPEAPGSLRDPAQTSLLPDWNRVAMTFGLIMAGFSSHPIIPSLYRDMKSPRHFGRMLDSAYVAAGALYVSVGVLGYLMFGRRVSGEISTDLARTDGYPRILTLFMVVLMTINPLTKFALATRPLYSTVEHALNVAELPPTLPDMPPSLSGIHVPERLEAESCISIPEPVATENNNWKRIVRFVIRTALAVSITVVAIMLPRLEQIMGFLGAFLAYITCIFGPLLAKLILFRREMTYCAVIFDAIIIAFTFVLAVIGTVWAFVPPV